MKVQGSAIFGEEQAASVGGHYAITVYFDNESAESVANMALEAIRKLRPSTEEDAGI